MGTMELAADLAKAAARLRSDAEEGGLDGDVGDIFADLAEALADLTLFVKILGEVEGGDVAVSAAGAVGDLESAHEGMREAAYAARA